MWNIKFKYSVKLLILRKGEFKHINSKEMVLKDEMSTFFKC